MSAKPAIGTRVRVIYYGYGATLRDCGRIGVVVRHNRTRVVVAWEDRLLGQPREAAIDPSVLKTL